MDMLINSRFINLEGDKGYKKCLYEYLLRFCDVYERNYGWDSGLVQWETDWLN